MWDKIWSKLHNKIVRDFASCLMKTWYIQPENGQWKSWKEAFVIKNSFREIDNSNKNIL